MTGTPVAPPGVVDNSNILSVPAMIGSSQEVTSSVSSSSSSESHVSSFLYFFILWIVLLLLILALVFHVGIQSERRRQNEQQAQGDNNKEAVDNNDQEAQIRITKTPQQRKGFFLVILLFLGAAIGLALSIISIVTCDFLYLENDITMTLPVTTNNGDSTIETTIVVLSLGLWGFGLTSSSDQACFALSDAQIGMDWQFKLAQASAVISSLFGGLCLLTLVVCCFKSKVRSMIRFLMWPFVAATFFQFLTLVLFETGYCNLDSNKNCQTSPGLVSSTTAGLYWTFCAFCTAGWIYSNRS